MRNSAFLRAWARERIRHFASLGKSYTTQLEIKIIWNVHKIVFGALIHRNAKFALLLSRMKRVLFHAWGDKKILNMIPKH